MPLATMSRSIGMLKLLPVRVSVQRLRRIFRITLWNVITEFRIHLLVQADVYLIGGLLNAHYRKVIQYLAWQYDTGQHIQIIIFHSTK